MKYVCRQARSLQSVVPTGLYLRDLPLNHHNESQNTFYSFQHSRPTQKLSFWKRFVRLIVFFKLFSPATLSSAFFVPLRTSLDVHRVPVVTECDRVRPPPLACSLAIPKRPDRANPSLVPTRQVLKLCSFCSVSLQFS